MEDNRERSDALMFRKVRNMLMMAYMIELVLYMVGPTIRAVKSEFEYKKRTKTENLKNRNDIIYASFED